MRVYTEAGPAPTSGEAEGPPETRALALNALCRLRSAARLKGGAHFYVGDSVVWLPPELPAGVRAC